MWHRDRKIGPNWLIHVNIVRQGYIFTHDIATYLTGTNRISHTQKQVKVKPTFKGLKRLLGHFCLLCGIGLVSIFHHKYNKQNYKVRRRAAGQRVNVSVDTHQV